MRARIRAAARDAQATLRRRYPREVAEALLQPIAALTRNRRFLAQPMPGLSIFVNPERARAVPLLDPVQPRVSLDGRFYFGPLLPQLSSDAVFWILVLDRPLRLLQATAGSARELSGEDLPGEVAHKLWPPASALEQARPDVFEPGAMRRVAGAVDRLLARRHQPLVLAGPTALREAFRAASHHPLTLYFGLELAPGEAATLEYLREQALSLVAPRFREAQRDALSEVREVSGTALGDSDVGRVLRQAQRGLLEQVVLAGPREAGTAAPQRPAAPQAHPRDRDEETTLQEQLSRIALYGRMNRSSVFVVPPDQVPGGGVVAARYRHVP